MNKSKVSIAIIRFFIAALIMVQTQWIFGQLNKGKDLPNVEVQNEKGQPVNLSAFQGKVLLIDFWASWCAPCRKANKKLVKLYENYKDNDFGIIGISLDTDKAKWQKAAQTDRLSYPQLTDPKGFDAPSATIFGVEALPASFLFDKSGKLVQINPSEDDIKNFLKQI